MKHLLRRRTLLAAAALAVLAPAFAAFRPLAEPPTVVIVVRHAEKQAEGADPGLSPEGEGRARALAEAAGQSDVRAIYTTQYRRTIDTAGPLSEAAGVPVTVFAATPANVARYGEALREEVLAKHRGETVVVVGHSNTVPMVVQAFGGRPAAPLSEADYDRFFVVVVPEEGPARVVQARYGG